jgi:hypothetical protein
MRRANLHDDPPPVDRPATCTAVAPEAVRTGESTPRTRRRVRINCLRQARQRPLPQAGVSAIATQVVRAVDNQRADAFPAL